MTEPEDPAAWRRRAIVQLAEAMRLLFAEQAQDLVARNVARARGESREAWQAILEELGRKEAGSGHPPAAPR